MKKTILFGIPDTPAARAFFDEYNIEFEIVQRGDFKGYVRVLAPRDLDHDRRLSTEKLFMTKGYDHFETRVIDHCYVFRDRAGGSVVAICPYLDKEYAEEIASEFRDVVVSEHCIYPGAVTLVRIFR